MFDRTVTIVVPQPEDARRERESFIDMKKQRLMMERSLLSRLQHPNIVSVFDAGLASHFPYFVIPQIVGPTLREVVDSTGALPPARAMRICLQIAKALAHVHSEAMMMLGGLNPDGIFLDGRSFTTDSVQIVEVLTKLYFPKATQQYKTDHPSQYGPVPT